MPPRRAVGTAASVGRRAAPDALVRAGPMPMQPRGTVRAPVPVARAPAPLAMLLVIAMLMKPIRPVGTPVSITGRPAMSAFRTHARIIANPRPRQTTFYKMWSIDRARQVASQSDLRAGGNDRRLLAAQNRSDQGYPPQQLPEDRA